MNRVNSLQHKYPHYTPYRYAGNKPVTFIDLDGLEENSPNHYEQMINTGNNEFDNFANKAIRRFGFSEDAKVKININNVEGEFVEGSVSVTENGITKTINFSPTDGFSNVSTTFDREIRYRNFVADADRTNVILPMPVVSQDGNKLPIPSLIAPKTEMQQLGVDKLSTWTKSTREHYFRMLDNQRKINEHILSLQQSDPFSFGNPGTVGVGMVPSLYEGMKQGAFMGIELTVVTTLPKIFYPLKSYQKFSKATAGQFKGLNIGYGHNTLRGQAYQAYKLELNFIQNSFLKSSKPFVGLPFRAFDAKSFYNTLKDN